MSSTCHYLRKVINVEMQEYLGYEKKVFEIFYLLVTNTFEFCVHLYGTVISKSWTVRKSRKEVKISVVDIRCLVTYTYHTSFRCNNYLLILILF